MIDLNNLSDAERFLNQQQQARDKILAHILQGVESQALLAILRAYPADIVLLQHDGFVSRCPLDIGGLEQLVLEATGFVMRLGVEQLELPVASSPATRISAK